MTQKNNLKLKNQTNEIFFKHLLKEKQFLIITYKNNDTINKTITKNQICNSLSNIINKKSEKFPLNLINFNNFETLIKHINLKKQLIISIIKIKNLFFKNKTQFKKINFNILNLLEIKIILAKKAKSFQILKEFIKNEMIFSNINT